MNMRDSAGAPVALSVRRADFHLAHSLLWVSTEAQLERSYGAFHRSVPLPEGVKADEAKATLKDGVLEVAMPAARAPEKHGRQLEIK